MHSGNSVTLCIGFLPLPTSFPCFSPLALRSHLPNEPQVLKLLSQHQCLKHPNIRYPAGHCLDLDIYKSEGGSRCRVVSRGAMRAEGDRGESRETSSMLLSQFRGEMKVAWSRVEAVGWSEVVGFWIPFEGRANGYAACSDVGYERQ